LGSMGTPLILLSFRVRVWIWQRILTRQSARIPPLLQSGGRARSRGRRG